MRGFHQGEITLIEHGTENREKQVTVPGVIMESRTGERNISNPKPNGLHRACCRREREIKRQREGEKQRALWGQSVSAAGFNKCCERSKLQLFSVMHAGCLNTESLLKIRKESWQEQSSFGLFYLIGSVSAITEWRRRSDAGGNVQCTFVTRADEHGDTSPMATRAYGDISLMHNTAWSSGHVVCGAQRFIIFVPSALGTE